MVRAKEKKNENNQRGRMERIDENVSSEEGKKSKKHQLFWKRTKAK